MIDNGPIEILLVEDNKSDAKLTMRALEKGHIVNRVQHVIDGQAALDYLFGEGQFEGRDPKRAPRVCYPWGTFFRPLPRSPSALDTAKRPPTAPWS